MTKEKLTDKIGKIRMYRINAFRNGFERGRYYAVSYFCKKSILKKIYNNNRFDSSNITKIRIKEVKEELFINDYIIENLELYSGLLITNNLI